MCAEPQLYSQPSLAPLNWVWECGKPGRGGPVFHANVSGLEESPGFMSQPLTPPPVRRAPVSSFWNNFFLPSHSVRLPSLSLTLRLATQAMSAIFTDSSHQPIWFSLPQTVTFIETSLQMSGLQTAGRSSPRGHSRGSWNWPGQVCWSWWMSLNTKLGWTKCWLITHMAFFFLLLLFLHVQFSRFSAGSSFKGGLLFTGRQIGGVFPSIWRPCSMMISRWDIMGVNPLGNDKQGHTAFSAEHTSSWWDVVEPWAPLSPGRLSETPGYQCNG